MSRCSRFAFLVGVFALIAAPSFGAPNDPFPNKPVQLLMQYPPGSGPDAVMRKISETVNKSLGQPLIVLNKPGANGWIAAGEVKRALPDGYTLLLTDNTATALQPYLFANMPFDPISDFEAIAPIYSVYFFIVVAQDSPWKSVRDLIAAAGESKGRLSAGSFGVGSVNQFGIAALESATRTKMTLIPYKSLQEMFIDVSAGRIAWAFGTGASVDPYLKSNKVRMLAVAAPHRLASHPNIPTVSESGAAAGFELKTWVALYGPKGIPKAVSDRIRDAVSAAMNQGSTRDFLSLIGFDPWQGSAADVVTATEADQLRFSAVVKQSGMTVN